MLYRGYGVDKKVKAYPTFVRIGPLLGHIGATRVRVASMTKLGDHVPDQPPERARLREHMEARQGHLGENWDAIARRAGIHEETFRRVRFGTGQMRPATRVAIERGLKWEPGSVRATLDGGDPTPLPETEDDRYATGAIDLGDRVIHLARDLNASARHHGVPPEEAAAMTRRALERALGAAEGTGVVALEHELQRWRREHDDTPGS